MPVDFQCGCGRWLRVGDEHAGSQAKCPYCARVVEVPAATALVPTAAGGGAYAPARVGGERFRRVSSAGLWLGITGCAAGVLFFVIAMVAGASARPSYRGGDGASPVLAIFALLLILVGAVTSIMGIVFGAKGMKPENVRYKPHAVGGLVTGIIGTCLAGCILALILIGVAAVMGR